MDSSPPQGPPLPTVVNDGAPTISRREVVGLIGGGLLATALPSCTAQENAPAGGPSLSDPLYHSTAGALASAIESKMLSSEEVVQAFLDRIDSVNGALNAVVQLAGEQALARAREADQATVRGVRWGPLHGVPMTIKDSLDTAGVITTGGTRGRTAFVPDTDATVVKRLKDAGAILMGKTNTPELTLAYETDNAVYGRTNNPFDLARTPGGSSGGAAAIIAAGGTPFDIGSDYGGSIRLPAHFCGIAGIKPTAGRVPRTGHIYPFGGLQDSMQQIGPLARSVDDLELLLDLIAGPDGIDPGVVPLFSGQSRDVPLESLRVSFHTDNGIATPTRETQETVQNVATGLSGSVLSVEEVRPAGIERAMELALTMFFWDGGASVRRLLEAAGTTESTLQAFTGAEAITAAQLDQHIADWYAYRSDMLSFFEEHDAIVCPVNGGPALPHGGTAGPDALPAFSYTFTYNLTGFPGAVVRGGTSPEGLPIGVQIVTRPGREDIALALARQVESNLGEFQGPVLPGV